MKRFLQTIIIGAVLTLVSWTTHAKEAAFPIDLAPSAELRYDVKATAFGLTLHGEAKVNWKVSGTPPDQHYTITTETRSPLFGVILEASSRGSIDPFGIAPAVYQEKALRKSPIKNTFDRDAQEIIFSDSDKTYAIRGGEQDRTSAVWQLVSWARGSPKKFVPKSEWSFAVAGRHTADPWDFIVDKKETLTTPMGKFSTLRISKVVTNPKEQHIDIWLAPSLDWYPVRITFREPNGDVIEQTLVDVTKNKDG